MASVRLQPVAKTMNPFLKSLTRGLSAALFAAGMTIIASAAGEPPRALERFREGNFGVSFSHPPTLTTSYNPHGGADRVIFEHGGEAIGALLIRPAPPNGSTEEFIKGGKDHYRKKGATTVTYALIQTPGGYPFHHLRARVPVEGTDYVIERYVYLRPKPEPAGPGPQSTEAVARAAVDSLAGAFSFEFFAKAADHPKIEADIRTVIDTFSLK
jgi:hypothetical protein